MGFWILINLLEALVKIKLWSNVDSMLAKRRNSKIPRMQDTMKCDDGHVGHTPLREQICFLWATGYYGYIYGKKYSMPTQWK